MGRKGDLLAEVHNLISKQLNVLTTTPSSPDWDDYIKRKKKIDDLLAEVGRDRFGDPQESNSHIT